MRGKMSSGEAIEKSRHRPVKELGLCSKCKEKSTKGFLKTVNK